MSNSGDVPCRIGIVGGGPGGLMTAYELQKRSPAHCSVTLYEAAGRLGGKIVSPRFASADVRYEAGAAELYDYSALGEDPLRELIAKLGLNVFSMSGASTVMDGNVLQDADDLGRAYGPAARQSLMDFDAHAKAWMSPNEYYDSDWSDADVNGPMTGRTLYDEFADVTHPDARRYLQIMIHSDLATEPHRTSAGYGLQNYLMNDDRYMRLYSIEGGMERLTQQLAALVHADIHLNETVTRVQRSPDGTVRVHSLRNGVQTCEDFDYLVIALPYGALSSIEWAGDHLANAMHCHIAHFDHPGHYLRISMLFQEQFWGHVFRDSYFMLDAFGGCCLYDESSRNGSKTHGVLGWLLAGDDAMRAANHTDDELSAIALDSLPAFLQQGRELALETRVHRWIGSVSGLPGGNSVLPIQTRHVPDDTMPNLMLVGDYLFDSTLNGVLDSATYVAETIAESVERRARSLQLAATL